MSTAMEPREPQKDHPQLWWAFAAVTVLVMVTDYPEFLVIVWWVSLAVAFAGNPTSRAKFMAWGERQQDRKLAKKQAKRTQHIYHHYEEKPGEHR